MKEKKYWLISSLACISVLFVTSQGAWGLIGGSGHDFSAEAWSNNEICLPCHTPHNADTTMIHSPPEWAQAQPSSAPLIPLQI
jgi:hypothetical protein